MISKRAQILMPSPTLLLDAKVKKMQAEGIKVINLTLGEPDFETPAYIKKGAIKAINDGFTHYTNTAGILELRTAISKKYFKENGVLYSPSEIIVGTGSKQLLYCLFQVILDKNDEVIIPLPTWSTYVEQIKLAGGKVIFAKLKPPFKLTLGDLKNKITSKTKAVLINSPSNPTGAVIEKKELEKIAKYLTEKNILIISDEIYEKIIYEKEHVSVCLFGKKVIKNSIIVNGVSKAYAMTGWRIGFALGPKNIIEKMVDLQSQMTSNASSIGQIAALYAISKSQKETERMRDEFMKRRNKIYKKLKTIKNLDVIKPEGAFYFFVGIQKPLNEKYKTSLDFCSDLLEKEKVAVVPGEAFLYPNYFRLSFAASFDLLEKAAERIKIFCEKN